MVRAVFCRNFRDKSLKFRFLCVFLAAFSASGVLLYADEAKNTTSASEFSAEQKHTDNRIRKNRFYYQKYDGKSGFL